MKTTQKTTAQQNLKKPENKDNLDSSKNEEFDIKGDDVTHNTKEHKSLKKKCED